MSMQNSSDTIGSQNRNLLTSSTVPQPTVPPRAPNCLHVTPTKILYLLPINTILEKAISYRLRECTNWKCLYL